MSALPRVLPWHLATLPTLEEAAAVFVHVEGHIAAVPGGVRRIRGGIRQISERGQIPICTYAVTLVGGHCFHPTRRNTHEHEHPAVSGVVQRIETDQIGGAADTAIEVAHALGRAIQESRATGVEALRDDCFAMFDVIMLSSPSLMPVTQVLHRLGSTVEAMDADTDVSDARARLVATAEEAASWLAGAVNGVARLGEDLIEDDEAVFTYSMSSTVYAMFRAAAGAGKRFRVITTESRPGNEGLGTIAVMGAIGIEVTVGIDAAIGQLLRDCTSVYVGGDTITAKGEALCKIGCFPTALLARHYAIPFRVAADTSKFDPNTALGVPLWIREMPVTDIVTGAVPSNATVRNPVFEIVPASLIDCVVTGRAWSVPVPLRAW